MYVSKRALVARIKTAASTYKQYLAGKTFMFVYGGEYLEVIFKNDSFMHLTGVASTLSAKDFMKKTFRRSLKHSEIYFDTNHPADFADIKTQHLHRLYELTISEVLLAKDINSMTAIYSIGVTNLEFVLCFGDNTDKAGNKFNDCLVPYSFRIEEIKNDKFGDLFEVDFIFSKNTNSNKYTELTYGNIENLDKLNKDIYQKLDDCLKQKQVIKK